ncbi:MAG: hypothetical protein OES79_15230 [Planctomycetota bacterium]|nr:hypothetical protein [Planctomycetota bacterium]
MGAGEPLSGGDADKDPEVPVSDTELPITPGLAGTTSRTAGG